MRTVATVVLILALGAVDVAGAQSLAELARQERARRTGSSAPGRTITTEAAETVRPGARLAVSRAAAAPPDAGGAAAGAGTTGTAGEEDAAPEGASPDGDLVPGASEEEWREAFADARAEIQRSEDQIALAELELADLNNQLLTRSDIFNREGQLLPMITASEEEIRQATARLAAARAALEKLTTDLRTGGHPAGWAR